MWFENNDSLRMKRIDLKVGFACNNECLFCVQGDKRLHHKPRTKEDILSKIDEGFNDGARGIVFTGGEPTVHPDLVESIRYARAKGFSIIQIQSNGRTFADEAFCRTLIDAGVTEFSPALHGFRPEIHDHLVQRPGAWRQVTQGIRNLAKLGQTILTNTVITQQNYRELPQLAQLFITLGVRQYQFAFVHILGSAAKNASAIVPRKSDIMPYVKRGLDIGRSAQIPCMVEAIPFCLMQGYEWAIAEFNFMPETAVFDAEYTIESYADYRWNEGKAKRAACRDCAKNSICEGPWKEYPEIYGWDEFTPVQK